MWPEKKTQTTTPSNLSAVSTLHGKSELDRSTREMTASPTDMTATDQKQAFLGTSLVLKGEMSGNEDLLIEGQFEGSINLEGHCLTVGPGGQVKAEIRAGRVVILGSVSGNITAKERIEIRKSGHVVGDLAGPGVSIEDGAYLKGSVEILREQSTQPLALSARSAKDQSLAASAQGSLSS